MCLFSTCIWPCRVSWSPGSGLIMSWMQSPQFLEFWLCKILTVIRYTQTCSITCTHCPFSSDDSFFVFLHLQSQTSCPAVFGADWGSGCSTYPGLLEGIQGTLHIMSRRVFVRVSIQTLFLLNTLLFEFKTTDMGSGCGCSTNRCMVGFSVTTAWYQTGEIGHTSFKN